MPLTDCAKFKVWNFDLELSGKTKFNIPCFCLRIFEIEVWLFDNWSSGRNVGEWRRFEIERKEEGRKSFVWKSPPSTPQPSCASHLPLALSIICSECSVSVRVWWWPYIHPLPRTFESSYKSGSNFSKNVKLTHNLTPKLLMLLWWSKWKWYDPVHWGSVDWKGGQLTGGHGRHGWGTLDTVGEVAWLRSTGGGCVSLESE